MATRCRRCGDLLTGSDAFCTRCGTRQGSSKGGALSAGWHADPFGRRPYRFFDGSEWTDRVWPDELGPDPIATDRHSAWRPSAGSLGLTLGGLVAAFALSVVFLLPWLFLGHPGGEVAALALSEAGLWSGLLGTCVLSVRRYGTGGIRRDFALRLSPLDVPIAIVGALVARCIAAAALVPLVRLHPVTTGPDQGLYRLDQSSLGWAVLVVLLCVGAPLVEELFFRGLLQGQLAERYSAGVAILLTSAVFGAAHFANAPGWSGLVLAVSVGAAGIVLGAVRHFTGRLGSSMLTHALFNATALVALAVQSH